MWIRLTLLCAAVAALSACSALAPASHADAQAPVVSAATYPSEYQQFRELGWDVPATH